MTAPGLTAGSFPLPLRPHQVAAVEAYSAAADPDRCHLVLPPGSGKTLIGAEIARRIGRPVVTLVPNTAIQAQWVELWQSLPGVTVCEDRSLSGDVTVLTYQAIATFDDDAVGVTLEDRLHPDAADLLERLAEGPPFTLILDEAHHLAETWGRVLAELLQRVQHGQVPIVIALTATPRSRLTPEQAALTDELFGPVLFTVATPALVRDRVLAPFRELVRFVAPSDSENEYLASSATHWQELITSLIDPQFASTGFLAHLDAAWVRRQASATGEDAVSWTTVERQYPQVARAILRLHAGTGLVDLPQGARLREEDRQPPVIEDWIALISSYGRTVLVDSTDPRDQEAWQRLRSGLRSVGWTLTRTGARRGQSPVDKVLQRTVSKADAAAQIVHHEFGVRGASLRAVVITDFERAAATPSADLKEVLDPQAGSAWEALAQIQATSPQLSPVLVTGSVVAGSVTSMSALVDFIRLSDPALADGLTESSEGQFTLLTGPRWTPRAWVPWLTRWFLAGGTHVLIGTRGLLGEGWDAAGVTTLVDLTAATTVTSVVQVRGRAIRRDPTDEDKAAHIWSVVAVSDAHPRGDLDYRRFVGKHEGFHAADPAGRIVLGVSHVSARCGLFHPPSAEERSSINAEMLSASERPQELAALWGVGQPYDGLDTAVVQVSGRRNAPLDLDATEAAIRRWRRARPLAPVVLGLLGAVGVGVGVGDWLAAVGGAVAGAMLGWLADWWARARARDRALGALGPQDTLLAIGRAMACWLGAPASAVGVAPDSTGIWRVWLDDPGKAAQFAAGIDQILAPIDWPRYVVSRHLPRRSAEVWHAVPDAAGRNKQTAQSFLRCWNDHVSVGALEYTGSAEGAGILAAARGLDPLAVETAMRVEWH